MPWIFLGNPGNQSCQQPEREITQHVGVGTDTLDTFLCSRVSVTAADKSCLRGSEASTLTAQVLHTLLLERQLSSGTFSTLKHGDVLQKRHTPLRQTDLALESRSIHKSSEPAGLPALYSVTIRPRRTVYGHAENRRTRASHLLLPVRLFRFKPRIRST